MKCKRCSKEETPKLYAPKKGLCKTCYNQDYYAVHQEKIKKRASDHHFDKRESKLIQMKERREKEAFDSKRMEIIIRDDYTCKDCKKRFDESQLVVHHEDRSGRGQDEDHNNDDENLDTQCRGCHCKEHTKEMHEARAKKYASRWAKDYDQCIECNTTTRKHQGKGLCINCHARARRKRLDGNIV